MGILAPTQRIFEDNLKVNKIALSNIRCPLKCHKVDLRTFAVVSCHWLLVVRSLVGRARDGGIENVAVATNPCICSFDIHFTEGV